MRKKTEFPAEGEDDDEVSEHAVVALRDEEVDRLFPSFVCHCGHFPLIIFPLPSVRPTSRVPVRARASALLSSKSVTHSFSPSIL